jgi:hypothetical protein
MTCVKELWVMRLNRQISDFVIDYATMVTYRCHVTDGCMVSNLVDVPQRIDCDAHQRAGQTSLRVKKNDALHFASHTPPSPPQPHKILHFVVPPPTQATKTRL